jgi:hypothetical protein
MGKKGMGGRLNHDGSLAAIWHGEARLEFFSTSDARKLGASPQWNGGIRGLAFSPDGALVRYATTDGMLHCWSIREARMFWKAKSGLGEAWGVRFSPDGRYCYRPVISAFLVGVCAAWKPRRPSQLTSAEPRSSAMTKRKFGLLAAARPARIETVPGKNFLRSTLFYSPGFISIWYRFHSIMTGLRRISLPTAYPFLPIGVFLTFSTKVQYFRFCFGWSRSFILRS